LTVDEDGEGREDEGEGEAPDGEPERQPAARPPKNPREYVANWSERDSLDGREERAWVLILRTSGCAWARCSMCGYHSEAAPATEEDLLHQFESAIGRRRGENIAKVYTSGSFLDDREVPPALRKRILGQLRGIFARVVVESRPEFVTDGTVKEALEACPGLEVAIGLESASPRVLSHSVRKGFGFGDFEKKARLVRAGGGRVRAYLLLKPPFLGEREALEDAVASALLAAPLCDTVSINPVNVQKGTVVEQLWRRRIYRPPWLWSAAEAVLRIRRELDGSAQRSGERKDPRDRVQGADGGTRGTRIVCAPSGAGRRRGAHNCGRCDEGVVRALESFTVTGSTESLEKVFAAGCSCLGQWRDALEAGAFPFISYDGLLPR
jgi:hypothetical protein